MTAIAELGAHRADRGGGEGEREEVLGDNDGIMVARSRAGRILRQTGGRDAVSTTDYFDA